jgi:hypothetical protein
MPRRIPARRDVRGDTDTQLADDSLYPAGGFTAITPGGSNANIENLVSSELVYMEDDPGPDLFTLRYIEGELLYNTRDDSVFRRHHHMIAFVIGADLDDARVKDRDVPWQRVIVAMGVVVAVVRWLVDQLGDRALAIRLAFPPGLLASERYVVSLLLEGEIERGIVTVIEQDLAEATAATLASGSGVLADLVVISLGDPPSLPKQVRARHVRPEHPEVWLDWCGAAEALLRWLV